MLWRLFLSHKELKGYQRGQETQEGFQNMPASAGPCLYPQRNDSDGEERHGARIFGMSFVVAS
jgi:hypothetical protein